LIAFRDYIEEHGGIHLEKEKFDSIRISVHSRATFHGFSNYSEYYNFLTKNEEEFRELISLIAINETYFFRYPEQFAVLREFILPEIAAKNRSRKENSIRIWSAGCSTGEEPFSIAISVVESLHDWKDWDVHILGTDVSNKALSIAMKGRYGKNSFRITSEEIREKYFRKVSFDFWEVKQFLKDLVMFSYHNLIKEPYPLIFMEMWDIIFCRNVTIYFRPESTKRVIENMFKSLKPGGYLFMGHTETLYHINPGFELVRYGDVFVFKKPDEVRKSEAENRFYEQAARFMPGKSRGSERRPLAAETDSSVDLASEILKSIDKNIDEAAEKLDILKSLIYTNLDEGKLEQAQADLEKALKENPFDSELHYLYGILMKKIDKNDCAENAFKKAVYLDHTNYLALMELANIKLEEGDKKEALKYYLRAKKSLNHIKQVDDRLNEDVDLLLRICEMMISDLKDEEE
jgi:chemotaxis protein methyltransferase CheR